jgi:hypothetical protein
VSTSAQYWFWHTFVSVGEVRQPPLQDGETVTNAAARLLKAGS